jgi:hypothetical protein
MKTHRRFCKTVPLEKPIKPLFKAALEQKKKFNSKFKQPQ